MRTITLELLRHGPGHNQLLSPLTEYLALCENHSAQTWRVPFEHNQFLHRLRALGYRISDEESRHFQLKDTAQLIGSLLAQIPGLTAAFGKGRVDGVPVTHLRLILSASELALLPFELANAPNGFPGAGQPLLLQAQMPICITREIRRISEDDQFLGRKKIVKKSEAAVSTPRILFAMASPRGAQIPGRAHLLALRRLVDPWLQEDDDRDSRREKLRQLLVVLPNASAESIQKACATNRFTHIHILAHGVPIPKVESRFGLALHHPRNPAETEVVDGVRLATALRTFEEPDVASLARPQLVTLASCDSANVGSVAGAGASIAHALHDAGIPIVIASQFPLSFAGSVIMVEELYKGLLWGRDPRLLLANLRGQLHTRVTAAHDWASIVAYASFGSDFSDCLERVQIERAIASIRAAMGRADVLVAQQLQYATRKSSKRARKNADDAANTTAPPNSSDAQPDEITRALDRALERAEKAKRRLSTLKTSDPQSLSRIFGHLASTAKRQAEIIWAKRDRQQPSTTSEPDDLLRRCKLLLEEARDLYWKAFLSEQSNSWGIVQHLSLVLVLEGPGLSSYPDPSKIPESDSRTPTALWTTAHLLSVNDLNHESHDRRLWACGNLVELCLLATLITNGIQTPQNCEEVAVSYARQLVELGRSDSFEIYSTRRQLERYQKWFKIIGCDAFRGNSTLQSLATKLVSVLPEPRTEEWN